MQVQVAIVGGGVGGTLIANRLRRLLHGDARHEIDITVYDAEGTHTYQPGWLYVPFARQDPRKLVRPERRLLHEGITLLSGDAGRVQRIVPGEKQLLTADGQAHTYDYLVLATGSRNAPEDVPGPVDADPLEARHGVPVFTSEASRSAKAWTSLRGTRIRRPTFT